MTKYIYIILHLNNVNKLLKTIGQYKFKFYI